MLDIKLIRKDINDIAQSLKSKGYHLDIDKYTDLENKRKLLQVSLQEKQSLLNKKSKLIGELRLKEEDISAKLKEVSELSDIIAKEKNSLDDIVAKINSFNLEMPNILHSSVSIGKNEDDNVEIKKHGKIPSFDFRPLDHIALTKKNKLLDFEASSKLTGSRFVVMHGNIAKLNRALISFMMDEHTNNNYKEVYVPYMVNSNTLYGAGQLPKFKKDLFRLEDTDYYMIPTAEVPLTNLLSNKAIKSEELPIKYVSHTPCFRKESGSYGKDTSGLMRHHQFDKVELVWVTNSSNSYKHLENLREDAESILQKLSLPYKVVCLCSGDTGFCASKTYDLEVWLPGQNKYREISSCSNCEDFQSRRINIKYKSSDNSKQYVHTLNGSGLAVGRTIIAILENYQTIDGRVRCPEVLKKYMGNQDFII